MNGTDQRHGTSRRTFLLRALGATAGVAVGLPLTAGVAHAAGPTQADWKFCGTCNGLFFSGADGNYYRQNQRCPAGGLHTPMGYNFVLPYNVPQTSTAQADWRFCGTCNGMFYSGAGGNYYRQNQRCPAGGLHTPMGYNFVLPHDVAASASAQAEWKFCGTCHGMFYSGVGGNYYRQNQRCPAGGLHTPMGYNFVLPHRGIDAAPPPASATMSAQERQIFDAINGERSRAGCGAALQVDTRLVGVAQAHSQDLAAHPGLWERGGVNQQGHTGSDNSQPGDRISRAVGKSGTENCYVQYFVGSDPGAPVQAALAYWLENTPQHHNHRDNALNCSHRTTGVGIAKGPGTVSSGPYAGQSATFYYFTQVFVD